MPTAARGPRSSSSSQHVDRMCGSESVDQYFLEEASEGPVARSGLRLVAEYCGHSAGPRKNPPLLPELVERKNREVSFQP